jgi:peptidoglycan/LPS O-acetylase OafA/YrhL
MELASGRRIATIDGMRGLAIVLVVWYHVWETCWQPSVIPFVNVSLQPIVETGWLGVELFFFISGFVLMLPIARDRLLDKPLPSWRTFFEKRVLKIVPSYVLCIAVLLALGVQSFPSVSAEVRDVVFHLLFVHNWFSVSYWTIDGAMWSLGVEIQFYVIFPLLAIAFVRAPVIVAAAMIAVANAWRIWALSVNHYFLAQREAQLPAYLDLFAIGMLCAFGYVYLALRRPEITRHAWAFSALMVAGLVAFWFLAANCYDIAHTQPEWPEPWKVEHRSLVGLTFAGVALGSLFAFPLVQRMLANPVLLFLAAISYNLYLWHQPIVYAFLGHHVPPYATIDPHDDRVWMRNFFLMTIPASILVATLVTYAFERPIMRLRRRPPRAAVLVSPTPEHA